MCSSWFISSPNLLLPCLIFPLKLKKKKKKALFFYYASSSVNRSLFFWIKDSLKNLMDASILFPRKAYKDAASVRIGYRSCLVTKKSNLVAYNNMFTSHTLCLLWVGWELGSHFFILRPDWFWSHCLECYCHGGRRTKGRKALCITRDVLTSKWQKSLPTFVH